MTTTTHTRTHVSNGCLAEYEAFAALIEGLTDKEWNLSLIHISEPTRPY